MPQIEKLISESCSTQKTDPKNAFSEISKVGPHSFTITKSKKLIINYKSQLSLGEISILIRWRFFHRIVQKMSNNIEKNRQNFNIDWRAEKGSYDEQVEHFCMNDEFADIYFIFNRDGAITVFL